MGDMMIGYSGGHIDRPKFREIRYSEGMDIPERYDRVEVKMDGIWGCLIIEKGYYRMYSRTGKIKAAGELPLGTSNEWDDKHKHILLGEYMHGSAWGHRKGIDKDFFVFDCLMYGSNDISDKSGVIRNRYARKLRRWLSDKGMKWIRRVYEYKSHQWEPLWKNKVMIDGYEGIVFKDSSASYGDKGAWMRMKAEIEIDYICKGFGDADEKSKYAGMVGSVIGTLYDKECEVKCSGLSEKDRQHYTDRATDYMGRVFTAKGNGYYPSGAVRHPKLVRWRDDKPMEECTYDQIPREIREGKIIHSKLDGAIFVGEKAV